MVDSSVILVFAAAGDLRRLDDRLAEPPAVRWCWRGLAIRGATQASPSPSFDEPTGGKLGELRRPRLGKFG
jgi:hypothetical protein